MQYSLVACKEQLCDLIFSAKEDLQGYRQLIRISWMDRTAAVK